jgi:hypothetical protein
VDNFAGAKCNLAEVPDTAAALTNAEIKRRNRQAWISKTIRPLIEKLDPLVRVGTGPTSAASRSVASGGAGADRAFGQLSGLSVPI